MPLCSLASRIHSTASTTAANISHWAPPFALQVASFDYAPESTQTTTCPNSAPARYSSVITPSNNGAAAAQEQRVPAALPIAAASAPRRRSSNSSGCSRLSASSSDDAAETAAGAQDTATGPRKQRPCECGKEGCVECAERARAAKAVVDELILLEAELDDLEGCDDYWGNDNNYSGCTGG
jgi:hypothetical protein